MIRSRKPESKAGGNIIECYFINTVWRLYPWTDCQSARLDHERHILGAGQNRDSEYWSGNYYFTIVIYLLLMPFTIKQQKFSKLSAKMNPELQAIQKRYEGKKDNDSMMAMQQETKRLFMQKYGVSPHRQLCADADSDADPVCSVSCVYERTGLCKPGKGSIFPDGGKACQHSRQCRIFKQLRELLQCCNVCKAVYQRGIYIR